MICHEQAQDIGSSSPGSVIEITGRHPLQHLICAHVVLTVWTMWVSDSLYSTATASHSGSYKNQFRCDPAPRL